VREAAAADADAVRLCSVVTEWREMPGRAVLFDFNGTLSDDEPLLFRVFADLCADRLGWVLTEADYFGRLAGHSDREILETVVAELRGDDPALVDRLLEERHERYRDLVLGDTGSPIRPATSALLEHLGATGVPLGLVTGAQRRDVDVVLEHSRTGNVFGVVVTVEDVVHGKPHPQGFLMAAEALGVPATRGVLVFEDSVAGVRAARAAGMTCVAVTGTHDRATLEREADAVVSRLGPHLFESAAAR
jgi:HAD superfamily hydrolase (TIGR01509 family)